MTLFITPATQNISSHAVAANNAQTNPPDKSIERDLMDLNGALAGQIAKQVVELMTEQESRRANMNDIFSVVSALKTIDQEGAETINPSAFNKEIGLDPHSPLSDAGAGKPPISKKGIWDVLLAYKLCEPGEAKPTNSAQLKNLIDKLENKNNSISTFSQDRALELNRFITSRDQAFSLNSNLLSQLMELLKSIIKQFG
ncbi:MAG: hypothetical protein JWQ10_3692 [Herbaspirillum sp.]|jgi:hypothetical protein|nr:hypothetical protein [Herbaspirillum sp.]